MEKKLTYGREALLFENSVNELLRDIEKHYGTFHFKVDKNRIADAERINIHLTRTNDGKGSFPDAEAFHKRKIAVLDAKNHSQTKIYRPQITKLLGDAEVRETKRAILVLQQDACLSKPAYDKCLEKRLTIVRLTKRASQSEMMISGLKDLNLSNLDEEYLTVQNRNRLNKALAQQFFKIIRPEILIRKDGCIDKRSKAWPDVEKKGDEDLKEKYGLIFKTDGEGNGERKVAEECLASIKFRAYIKTRNQKFLIYYDQDQQKATYDKIREKKKQAKSKENDKKDEYEDEEKEEAKKEKEEEEEESTTDEDDEDLSSEGTGDPETFQRYLGRIRSHEAHQNIDKVYFDECE